jgi:hypothetical protein
MCTDVLCAVIHSRKICFQFLVGAECPALSGPIDQPCLSHALKQSRCLPRSFLTSDVRALCARSRHLRNELLKNITVHICE